MYIDIYIDINIYSCRWLKVEVHSIHVIKLKNIIERFFRTTNDETSFILPV
jgi:hypothetical protein